MTQMQHEHIRQRDKNIKLTVSLMVILTLFSAFLVSWMNKSMLHPLKGTYTLYAETVQAHALTEGMVVTLVGIPIGNLAKLELTPQQHIRLTLSLLEKYQPHIHSDSVLTIDAPIIGNTKLDISLGNPNQPALQSGELLQVQHSKPLEKVLAELPDMQQKITSVLSNIDVLLQQLTSPNGQFNQTLLALQQTLNGIQQLQTQLQQQTQQLPTLLESLQANSEQFNQLLVQGTDAKHGLGATLQATQQLMRTSQRSVHQKNQEISQLVQDAQQLLQQVLQLSQQWQLISQSIQQQLPEGPKLLNQAQQTLLQTDDVIRAMKQNPLLKNAFPQPPQQTLLHNSPRRLPDAP